MQIVESDNREAMFRNLLCEIGQRLWSRGLVAAHDGNISVRLNSENVLCTPTGVSKGFMAPEELVVVDLEGRLIKGSAKPSSELKMHLEIYLQRADVNAVVHAHPPHATAFAVAGMDIPGNVMPEIDVLLGRVSLIPYHPPGTKEFAEAFRPYLNDSNAFLLSNHGVTTIGSTLDEAWFRMESLDACCKTLLMARQLGGWTNFT